MQYLYSFLAGGLLCVIAQILIDKTKLTPARILTAYVCAGVLLTAIGLYEPFVDFAGSGAAVPLTGFGYSLAKGVEQSVNESGWIGAFSGGLSACSAGIEAAIFFGLVFSLIRMAAGKVSKKRV
ncbi:MAG: stage V sporulation protein AE [Clostridia bacterium]|nr:stage V sporulation protein AE [Clostridia bacterium]